MGATTKQHTFSLFFNFDGVGWTRVRAEKRREDAATCLKSLFENEAKFSCVAKDESKDGNCLLLRVCVDLDSPCTQACAERLLGKCGSCEPSCFGDVVSPCRFVHIDGNLATTGRLPCVGNNSIKNVKPFATDPKFTVKALLDSIDKKDFETEGNSTNE